MAAMPFVRQALHHPTAAFTQFKDHKMTASLMSRSQLELQVELVQSRAGASVGRAGDWGTNEPSAEQSAGEPGDSGGPQAACLSFLLRFAFTTRR